MQNDADRALVAELLDSLTQCLAYIEHKAANEGRSTTDAEWDANVAQFRKTTSRISIGRSHVPKAEVDLDVVRKAIAKAQASMAGASA